MASHYKIDHHITRLESLAACSTRMGRLLSVMTPHNLTRRSCGDICCAIVPHAWWIGDENKNGVITNTRKRKSQN
jgi:hypothetical protein